MKELVKQLTQEHQLESKDYLTLIENCDNDTFDFLRNEAVKVSTKHFGKGIYIRGLIEISSHCHNDCFYCGLRCSNKTIDRYRLSEDDILNCCISGYKKGIRTFVLQGGEDLFFNDNVLCRIITKIKNKYPETAITLSIGERSKASYQNLFNAGASRYLLRHEAADLNLYKILHPTWMSQKNRIECIENLISIGYQTGMGMMIGVPGQTQDSLVKDLLLMQQLRPAMIGIGPFIPHKDTPFHNNDSGDLRLTLIMISIIRLMFPNALIPATTALSTLSKKGRIEGILSGANVVMPNLSPLLVRDKYSIYNNKAHTGTESAEHIDLLEKELNSIGYHIDYSKGDYKNLE